MGVSFDEEVTRKYLVSLEKPDQHLLFVFPPYSDPAFQAAILEMLKTSNNVRRGLLGDDQEITAQLKFFNEQTRDVKNFVWKRDDKEEPRNSQTDPAWRNAIPPHAKAAVAAYFTQRITLDGDDAKNSSDQQGTPSR